MNIYGQFFTGEDFSDNKRRSVGRKLLAELYTGLPPSVVAFPIFGTLLGMVRDNDIIKHDIDIDIGFIDPSNHMISYLNNLTNWIFVRNLGGSLLSVFCDGVMFDLYKYVPNGNVYDQPGHPDYRLLKSEVEPMKHIEFFDTEFTCIGNPITFFERYYGMDWKTPKDFRK